MRIVQETSSLMVLKDRNILAFFVGGIFILLGILGIFSPGFFSEGVPLWLYIIFILLGLSAIFIAKITTIVFDKSKNKVFFTARRLIGEQRRDHSLDQIKEIQLRHVYEQASTVKKQSLPRYSQKVFLILKNGQEIPLTTGASTHVRIAGLNIFSNQRAIGVRISNFLNVPLTEIKPPSVGEIFSKMSDTAQEMIKKSQQEKLE